MKMELMKREAETSGIKMYGADRGCLTLPQAAAVSAAAAGAVDDVPAAEDSNSNSGNESIIGDA